uniref:Hydrogenosomal Fe-hydrogenase n=2 Tax=Nyctotherus ovalis TaxID=70075 RepID=Q5DM85_NYCOV|nr:hydrogenosomal Fe- hydrogenase [Nyctotherus ovalis]
MISRLIVKRAPLFLRAFATSEMVSLKIDGKTISVPKGIMLADAIKKAGANVPTMCYHPDLPTSGGICRVCLVESAKSPGYPIISCRTPVEEGMEIITQGSKMKEYRQANLALMLSRHPNACLSCASNTNCKTQDLSSNMNIGQCGFANSTPPKSSDTYDVTTAIERDNDKCINCDICVHTCSLQGLNALGFYNEEGHFVKSMGTLDTSECIQCGQCINRCPTGAITEKSEIRPVLDAINDPTKTVVFQMAPSIRVAVAEEFGFKPGEKILKNEIATALRKLGSNVFVLDTNFSADLTIIEEGHELIERLYRNVTGKKLLGDDHMPIELPMLTSCCPGWIMFMEKNYPDMLNHLSTCKSPQGMLGALIKGYWAKNIKKMDPKDIVSVSIMPCTAKKAEKERPQLRGDEGYKDVDYILTTRELAKMLKQSNIDLGKMEPTPFDKVMSEGTGAAVIFGVTGGVMEAALRTAYEVITGREVPFKNLNIEAVRGMDGIREAGIKLENVLDKYKAFEGVTVKVAIAHGPNNARKVMDIIKRAKDSGKPAPWHFVEVMACPGGCIGGGGQPKPTNLEIRQARTKLTFKEDMDLPLRKSHDNPEIKAIYETYLKEPLGHNSHHYLHTTYSSQKVRDMNLYNPNEAAGLDEILAKYPKEREYLLPIIIEEHDKKGYISDPSIVKISEYLGMYPAQIDSILSSYHYFPREHTSDAHVYMCTCHNCMMKGQGRLLKTIQETYDINKTHGGVAKDGSFTLHTLNWLGYCVNDAPAMMIKRKGTNYVETFTGLLEDNIDQRRKALKDLKKELPKWPKNNIKEMRSQRDGNGYSCMNTQAPIAEATKKAVSMGPEKVIEEIFKSNLVGRGGAGFRTGKKWESAYKTPATDKYVVCNADEGLPSTYKDWCLLNHEVKRKEVFTGMGICAKTIGAKRCFLYLRYEYRNLVPALEQAIKDVQRTCPELADLKYEIRLGGGPYVAGEENAQFESIEGRAPLPRKDRPGNVFPTMEGLFHKPTVINNVETFFAVPHIIQQGSQDFGEGKMPKLLSVTGDVEQPILIETHLNNYSLNHLLKEIDAKDIVAAEIGGCTEPIIFGSKFDTLFGFGKGTLNAVGSVVLFNSSCDLGKIYENKLKFMSEESCKQCVPCRDGSYIFHRAFKELRDTGKSSYNMRALSVASESAARSSICAHGKALEGLVKAAFDFMNKTKPNY